MASLCSGPDHPLVISYCHGDSFAALGAGRSANFVPARVNLSSKHLHGGGSGSPSEREEFGAVRRILSTGAGVARESKFRVGCSETQTVVSAQNVQVIGIELSRTGSRSHKEMKCKRSKGKRTATEDPKIVCEVCRGLGFFICDYCEGEKVNVPVKNRNNRFHRRCPTCRAVGVLMCSRCRVFKCVTFPDEDDGSLEKKR